MTKPSVWIGVGVLLLVVNALLSLMTIVGPAYVWGMIGARPDEPALSSFATGMQGYVAEMHERFHMSLGAIYYRLASKSAVAIGLIVAAVFLAFRKAWAWKALFAILGLAALNFTVLVIALVARNPGRFSLGWFLGSIGLEDAILYGAVLLIFSSRPVRAIYSAPGRT